MQCHVEADVDPDEDVAEEDLSEIFDKIGLANDKALFQQWADLVPVAQGRDSSGCCHWISHVLSVVWISAKE